MTLAVPFWAWAAFAAFVVAMLTLDLFVLHRRAHELSLKEAAAWSGIWVAIGLGFAGLLWAWQGRAIGQAYLAGMSRVLAAGAEFVVQMDSDLSHAPRYLPQMLGTLLSTSADVVIGSRYVAGASLASEWSWHRRALSGFANYYVRALLRLGIRDVTAGFKIWRSSALEAIDMASIRSNGYSFQVEMNFRSVRHGLKIVELPIHFAERREGDSKMNLRVQLESALIPFLLRRRAH